MSFFDHLIDKIGLKPTPAVVPTPPQNPVQRVLDEGQWAKRGEDYDMALTRFDEAQRLAEAAGDYTSQAIITLHRAEVLIKLGRYDEAEQMLLQMRHHAQITGQHTQLSYVLCTLGTSVQAQGDWDEARAYYEQARKVAKAAGSTGGEGRATAYLADTYLHEDNASYAAHLLRDALPKLNLSGDIEYSSYFVGQLGQALILTGQETEGERMLHRALRLGKQMKYRPFERRWALVLAARAAGNVRYEEAYQHYQQALALFHERIDPGLRARTLCEASRICLYLAESGPALDYAQQAVALCEANQLGAILPLAQGTLGMGLHAADQINEAVPYLEKAVKNTGDTTPLDSLQIEVRRTLAAARAGQGDLEAAVTLYTSTLQLTNDMPLEKAQTHLELGLIYEQQRDIQAAIAQWSAALTIYEGERYFAQAARLYCDIGGARRFLGQGKRALKEYEQALMMLSSVDDWGTRGIVVSNAAIAYADIGDVESAEAFFEEAIEIAHRLQDSAAEATRLGNYGWFLLSSGRPQRALTTLERALTLSEQEGLALQVAVQKDNLGLVYGALGEHDMALAHHRDALERLHEAEYPHWHSIVRINLASTLIALGEIDEAQPLAQAALATGRETSDVEVIVRALLTQAHLALHNQQPLEAGGLLEEATTLARRADMRRQLAEALHLQSEQQAALNKTDRSHSLWDEAQKLFTMMQMPQAEREPDWLKM